MWLWLRGGGLGREGRGRKRGNVIKDDQNILFGWIVSKNRIFYQLQEILSKLKASTKLFFSPPFRSARLYHQPSSGLMKCWDIPDWMENWYKMWIWEDICLIQLSKNYFFLLSLPVSERTRRRRWKKLPQTTFCSVFCPAMSSSPCCLLDKCLLVN